MRPILGINDLSRAIKTLINNDDSRLSGIYNLASLNATAEEIAKSVSEILKLPVVEYQKNDIEKITNVKLQTTAYNFAISSRKFEKQFSFEFKDTIESIVEGILLNFDNCKKTNRNYPKIYE